MKKYYYIRLILLAALLAVLLVTACQQVTPPAKATIRDIRSNPSAYEGKVVIIEGKYQGWQGGFGGPPETRSDWVVQDATGWLYVTGKSAGLDPQHDIGRQIKVTGLVKISKDGEPYLYAQEIEIKPTKASARLLLQIDLREKQLTAPTAERLEQMKKMGMRTENLNIQRIFIHLAQEPKAGQIDELEAIGITPYPDSWIPAASGPSAGFIVADMPIDKLDELESKDYVIELDSAEQVLEPQAAPH